MDRAQRITAIAEAVALLDSMDAVTATVTLREFGWNSYQFINPESEHNQRIFVNFLQSLDAEDFLEIIRYLRGENPIPKTIELAGSGVIQPVAFISHDSVHKEIASRVKIALSHYGIDGFVAHEDIEPSEEWRNVIKTQLEACDVLVVLLTAGLDAKTWCQQEIGWCLARNIPIYPINMTGSDFPVGFLSEIQYSKYPKETFDAVTRRIVERLLVESNSKSSMRITICSRLLNSYSFDQTRRLWAFISKFSELSAEERTLIERALAENPQVNGCDFSGTGAPTAISKLLSG